MGIALLLTFFRSYAYCSPYPSWAFSTWWHSSFVLLFLVWQANLWFCVAVQMQTEMLCGLQQWEWRAPSSSERSPPHLPSGMVQLAPRERIFACSIHLKPKARFHNRKSMQLALSSTFMKERFFTSKRNWPELLSTNRDNFYRPQEKHFESGFYQQIQ
jgi:hypothetical protein